MMSAANIIRCLLIAVVVFQRFARALPASDVVRRKALKEIRQYMNESVDPCENFYEFACGNWGKYYAATEDKPHTGLYYLMSMEFDRKVKQLLIKNDKNDETTAVKSNSNRAAEAMAQSNHTSVAAKVKAYYNSCMALSDIWDVYLLQLKDIISEFGQMPAMADDQWQEQSFDWQQTLTSIQYKYGFPIILTSGVAPDSANVSVNAFYIGTLPFFLGSKSIYVDAEHKAIRDKYKQALAKNMAYFLDIPTLVAQQTADEIVEFEVTLNRGLPNESLGLQKDDIFKKITIEELQRKYLPVMDIKKIVHNIWKSVPRNYSYYEERMYLEHLMKVIPQTPKRTVANYIFYQLIHPFLFKLTEDIDSHQEECITTVKQYFGEVFESMVYRSFNMESQKLALDNMWETLRAAFNEILDSAELNWIQRETRLYARDKMMAMKIEVSASKDSRNKKHKFLEGITIDQRDFLENTKQLLMASTQDDRAMLYKPPVVSYDDEDAAFTPIHYVRRNTITVPVAVLQPHYLVSASLPQAYNYGRLGNIVAHELIHGFDDTGRLHDKFGNSRQWWDTESTNSFTERVKCFVDQYQRYEYGGQHLPQRNNQAENIADNSGARVAYRAYLKWYEDSKRSRHERAWETLKDFSYNNKQLFFISYAQQWCADTLPASKLERVAGDEHAPEDFRVIGTLSNMEEFAKAFNCPAGTAMNPVNKCRIY